MLNYPWVEDNVGVWIAEFEMIGITDTISVVYIYCVRTLTSNVIFGETKLFCDLSVTVVAVVIDNISIRLFWYSTARICAVYFNDYYYINQTPTQKDWVWHTYLKQQKKFKETKHHLSKYWYWYCAWSKNWYRQTVASSTQRLDMQFLSTFNELIIRYSRKFLMYDAGVYVNNSNMNDECNIKHRHQHPHRHRSKHNQHQTPQLEISEIRSTCITYNPCN